MCCCCFVVVILFLLFVGVWCVACVFAYVDCFVCRLRGCCSFVLCCCLMCFVVLRFLFLLICDGTA